MKNDFQVEGGDDQGISSRILFKSEADQSGCDFGRFVQLYMSTLDPQSNIVFQKPKIESQDFEIHDYEKNLILFEKTPLEEWKLRRSAERLCQALGRPPVRNGDIRVTAICLLKRLNFEDREISLVCGKLGIF